MFFKFEYGALFTYSPRGQSVDSITSRKLRDRVKAGNEKTLSVAADMIKEGKLGSHALASILKQSTVLVPVPRSSLTVSGTLWPALKIAEALIHVGIGKDIRPYLKRTTAISKSAYQKQGERPTLETHIASLTVTEQSILPIEFTLVDDFITKGVTLYSCAKLIQKSFPQATIRCFALVRTMGLVTDVRRLVDPCIGTITENQAEVTRSHNTYE